MTMPEGSTSLYADGHPPRQALVEYVENPQNLPASACCRGPTTIRPRSIYCRAICRCRRKFATPTSIQHPRALTAVELEHYLTREVEYLRERLAYVERKLQQLWHTAGLTEPQGASCARAWSSRSPIASSQRCGSGESTARDNARSGRLMKNCQQRRMNMGVRADQGFLRGSG